VLLFEVSELAPGARAYARFRLEAPLVALPGDRFVVRSYSPIVTIGGGTLLDVDPGRMRVKAPARVAHLRVLETDTAEAVVEEHVRHAGVAGVRFGALVARVPFGPPRTRALLDALVAAGRVAAVDREWFLHLDAITRLRTAILAALEQFHRAQALRPGMSREELRGRGGGADDRVFTHVLALLDAEGAVRVDRDKVRLGSHEVRLTPEQQTVVDRVEREFREAAAAPPSAADALGRAGVRGDEDHDLFQVLLESRRLVRVKENLFFHADALDAIQDKLVALLHERKEIGPADIKDLLGISRKYAIPLLEFFDNRRVTTRVGERRVLRGA
jgi:selenocysteine-specific elongation factor